MYKIFRTTTFKKDYKKCHVKPDLLLVYRFDDDILELALVRVGSHSKLF